MTRFGWLLLLIAPFCYGQYLPAGAVFPVGGGGCSPFTDSFSGSGALSASWTNVPSLSVNSGTMVQSSGVAEASAAFKGGGSIVTACTPASTSYAQYTISAIDASNYTEPMVRMDASGNGYLMEVLSGGNAVIQICTAGTCTFLASAACSYAAGNVVKLQASGSTLTAYNNGTSCGTATDSTYAAGHGYSGLAVNNGNSASIVAKASSFSAD